MELLDNPQTQAAQHDNIQIMFTTKPCTATCVLDGAPVTLTFFPDTHLLRICSAAGVCLREVRWPASWRILLATLREFSQRDDGSGVESRLDEMLDNQPAPAMA
ncbi:MULTISPECIES: hypothetical protein [unclassified Caballeronia]|uniref:hypothetical protein n=1 Tax=unclassified Caballeronia TaxID=2646786 RepID=UPI00385729B6